MSTASLTVPPALQTGPMGVIWNPAANVGSAELNAAASFVQTSNVVGLSSMMLGVSRTAGPNGRIGVALGRTDVRDLVRTTSSPTSQGEIPVYSQFLGISGQYALRRLVLGGMIQLNHARFNIERDHGITFDFGARVNLTPRLALAASTHLLSVEFSGAETTDYYAGAEFLVLPHFDIGSIESSLIARYGITYTGLKQLEHMVSWGMVIGGHFHVDASVAREAGYDSQGWRPAVGVAVNVGRYRLGIARSHGLNDLGATYRIGLDAAVFP